VILHDWAPDRARAILRWAALPSGGQVIIAELLVNDERTGPAAAALMSLNMLVETEGRNYTPAEYAACGWASWAARTSARSGSRLRGPTVP
jgi:hypothetical protein